MKKVLRVILIVLLALAVLITAFVLLYRHFVVNQIMDRGGMENPFPESREAAETSTEEFTNMEADNVNEKEED